MIFHSDALVDMDAEKQADGNCCCPLTSKYIRVVLSADNLLVHAECVEGFGIDNGLFHHLTVHPYR